MPLDLKGRSKEKIEVEKENVGGRSAPSPSSPDCSVIDPRIHRFRPPDSSVIDLRIRPEQSAARDGWCGRDMGQLSGLSIAIGHSLFLLFFRNGNVTQGVPSSPIARYVVRDASPNWYVDAMLGRPRDTGPELHHGRGTHMADTMSLDGNLPA